MIQHHAGAYFAHGQILSAFGHAAARLVDAAKRDQANRMHLEDLHPERPHCERSERDLAQAMDSMADYAQVTE